MGGWFWGGWWCVCGLWWVGGDVGFWGGGLLVAGFCVVACWGVRGLLCVLLGVFLVLWVDEEDGLGAVFALVDEDLGLVDVDLS
ncbi:hypothetical protein, partial [Pseudomonas syringae group genomosp. 7]|uniref:hypothetical protein n=1 Tax=Pseudomonas syringae group genomosp. 7 TaxID=251699 RepID=UPI0037706D33